MPVIVKFIEVILVLLLGWSILTLPFSGIRVEMNIKPLQIDECNGTKSCGGEQFLKVWPGNQDKKDHDDAAYEVSEEVFYLNWLLIYKIISGIDKRINVNIIRPKTPYLKAFKTLFNQVNYGIYL